jgi:hypothetical protein
MPEKERSAVNVQGLHRRKLDSKIIHINNKNKLIPCTSGFLILNVSKVIYNLYFRLR